MKKGFLYGFVGAIVKIVFPYKIVYKDILLYSTIQKQISQQYFDGET